ncbi:MAG TPA: DNA translocase FtsK 4TM domain-containing protein [Anaerolineales bacterium]
MARRRSRRSSSKNRKGAADSALGHAVAGPLRGLKGLLVRGWSAMGGVLGGHKQEVGGVLMVAVGLLTLLTLLSPTQGLLASSWLRALRFLFGWGMILFPLALVTAGLWLLLRNFEAELPSLQAEQVVGAVMLAIALLAGLQAIDGRLTMEAGLEAAQQGRGGGLLGTSIVAALIGGFGLAGALVLVLAWSLVGAAFASGRGVPTVLETALAGLDRAGVWLDGLRKSEDQQLVPPIASPTAPAASPAGGPGQAEPTAPPIRTTSSSAKLAWKLPDYQELLEPGEEGSADHSFDRDRATLIEDTLRSFGAPARVVEINRGPTITQFGVEPDFVEGRGGRRVKVKVSKISSLADDLALALAAPSIRIEAPVPGKGFVGIEVPNPEVSLVALRDVMDSKAYQKVNSRLRIGLGRDVSGHPVTADLTSMPHLLIAGTTGSGKSVCVNAVVAGLLLQNTPDQLRFIMVDPKRVELTFYNGIPHLLAPVVVDLDRVVPALQWVSREMDERYRRFAEVGVRNIAAFNDGCRQQGQAELPYLVVIVDELADLMMMAPDETERVLTRLAQLARATGIHLVIATQRPSVDVVTGLIKANFPARIAFAVASSIDSRVILDQPGAERLLGRGDMLFQAPDAAAPKRLQGVYVSEPELARLIRHWRVESVEGEQSEAEPGESAEMATEAGPPKQAALWKEIEEANDQDDMFEEAVALVRRRRRASISMLQRRLRIGYTRAARLIDMMEQQGIVGPEPGGSKAREVLDYGELETEAGS